MMVVELKNANIGAHADCSQREWLMEWRDRIVVDPEILVGKPIVKGTRIAVEFLLELLAEGWSYEQILENYPQLTREDIQAALRYAAEILREERVYPLAV